MSWSTDRSTGSSGTGCPNRAELAGIQEHRLHSSLFGSFRGTIGKSWACVAQTAQVLVEVGPNLADIDTDLVETLPSLAEFGRSRSVSIRIRPKA